ncbi:MAG TPA: low-specificity L-threonine aldolase [Ignavibacteria bacterium]|nr:low-specificity L-threonine aldolase [Ignavibacteria bacterium]
MIDLRSDTLTKPDKPMLEAMMAAEVGDDVFMEDVTVNDLQRKCAILSGKDDALFVPTGVMGNQLAIKCHTEPGNEVIVESESHILNYETAAPSVISNVQLFPVKGNNGILYSDDIKDFIRGTEYYFPVTKLICLENTHNRAGGVILPIESIESISTLAKEKNIKTHLDGARIFNAIAETEITLKTYATYFDSISFCFSKGLGCPVGSILCGSFEFIEKARKWRKILGGGMRQAGILAGAAIYAMSNNVERLKTDNDRAKEFAKKLFELGFDLNPELVQTNIIIFKHPKYPKTDLMNKFKDMKVLISSGSYDYLRIVFHKDISEENYQNLLNMFVNFV